YAIMTHILFFFFNPTAPTAIYTLSLHDALPIYDRVDLGAELRREGARRIELTPHHTRDDVDVLRLAVQAAAREHLPEHDGRAEEDRKSTRLNSSHVAISYAVFCLKKKKKQKH